MHTDLGQIVVIQARAGQLPVFQIEAERLDQMKFRTGIGGQPDHVSGVGGDFRLIKNHMKHLNTFENRGNFSNNQ